MILGDQFLRYFRIMGPFADLARDEFGKLGIGLLVNQDVAEMAEPDAEAGRIVKLLPKRQPLVFENFPELAQIRPVDEATRRFQAFCKDHVIGGLNPGLVSPSMGLLCNGAYQFRHRWNTFKSPTLSAISAIICTVVAPGTGIAVPVQSAAGAVTRFVNGDVHAQFEQTVQLINPADTGANDDQLVL
jgi:hypothetical protein